MATQSYKERMKAQRAEARAKRLVAEAWQRHRAQVYTETRRLALEATKAIRDRGERVTHYSHAKLRVMADEMIGPWLVVQARANIARRTAKAVFVKLQEIEHCARRTGHILKQSVNTSPVTEQVSQ